MSGTRGLTEGEIELAQSIYGDAIDYEKVEIHDHSYLPDVDIAQSPNGDIYYPEDDYHEDFSMKDAPEKATFIHEMGHVLQDQNGINVAGRVIRENLFGGHPRGDYDWADKFEAGKEFHKWDLEEQAQFFRDIYLTREIENFPTPDGITKEEMETFFKSLDLNESTDKESSLDGLHKYGTVPLRGYTPDIDVSTDPRHASADAYLEQAIEQAGSTPPFVPYGQVVQQFSDDRESLRISDPEATQLVTQAANHPEAEEMFVRLNQAGIERFPSESLDGHTPEDRVGNILIQAQEIDQALDTQRSTPYEHDSARDNHVQTYQIEDEYDYSLGG